MVIQVNILLGRITPKTGSYYGPILDQDGRDKTNPAAMSYGSSLQESPLTVSLI